MPTSSTAHTLAELFTLTATKAKWPAFRVKNTKTAIKRLATGLGRNDPGQCPASDYDKPVDELIDVLNRALIGKKAAVVRNMRNYLRAFLRTATELGLVTPKTAVTKSPPARVPTRARQTAYRMTSAQWPESLQQWWAQGNLSRTTQLRAVTRARCQAALESYVGFLKNKAQVSRDLYRPSHFREFIMWHGARGGTEGFTVTSKWLLYALSVCATSKKETAALRAVRNTFQPATRVHNKTREVAGLSLCELERVGLLLLEKARHPVSTKSKNETPSPRVRLLRANAFRDGFILRLLVRVPMQQGHIRQMRLGTNLYKEKNGRWVIHFHGEELTRAWRGGKENSWKVQFPTDLCPLLQEYTRSIRPVLSKGQPTTLMFPNSRGQELTGKKLHLKLARWVSQYLQKQFYPDLIRSMWPAEMARANADIRAVAHMMNERIETSLQKYYSQNGEGLQQQAEESLHHILEKM